MLRFVHDFKHEVKEGWKRLISIGLSILDVLCIGWHVDRSWSIQSVIVCEQILANFFDARRERSRRGHGRR